MALVMDSPLGRLAIETRDQAVLTGIAFAPASTPLTDEARLTANPVVSQLREYFAGGRKVFDLAYEFIAGTAFQRGVWQRIAEIRFGNTLTYGDLARALGRPGSSRAVGAACGANPIAIVVPCHRVVGANQRLTGYGGGLALKAR